MSAHGHRSSGTAIGAVRRTAVDGTERCYVRLAVLGGRPGWPQALAGRVAAAHDVSYCDASVANATAYDVRRVQLRVALAHRPHLVALDVGLADLGRRDWDVTAIRNHLSHCVHLLSRRGAVVLTTGVNGRSRWHRARGAQLDEVYDDLARRFGTVHVGGVSAAEVADRFAEVLARRGLVLPH